jgi:hypothetical protein
LKKSGCARRKQDDCALKKGNAAAPKKKEHVWKSRSASAPKLMLRVVVPKRLRFDWRICGVALKRKRV